MTSMPKNFMPLFNQDKLKFWLHKVFQKSYIEITVWLDLGEMSGIWWHNVFGQFVTHLSQNMMIVHAAYLMQQWLWPPPPPYNKPTPLTTEPF